jgi:hypothetical protein
VAAGTAKGAGADLADGIVEGLVTLEGLGNEGFETAGDATGKPEEGIEIGPGASRYSEADMRAYEMCRQAEKHT